MKTFRSFGVLGLALILSGIARGQAADVALPPGSVDVDTTMVLWVDVKAMTPEMIEKTRGAVDAALSPDAVKQSDQAWIRMEDWQKSLAQAGCETAVMTLHNKIADTDNKAAATTQPGGMLDGGLCFRLKPGTDPEQFAATMRDYVIKQAKEGGMPIPADHDLSKVGVKPLTKDWVYLVAPDAYVPTAAVAGQDDSVLGLFNKSLNLNSGSMVRLAYRMTDETRVELRANSLEVSPMLSVVAELMRNLTSLEVANAGIYPGDKPHLAVAMHFPELNSATAFKNSLATVVTSLATLSQVAGALAPDGSKNDTEVFRAALSPLLMTQDGQDLTTSIDTVFIKKLTDLQSKVATTQASGPN